MNFMKGKKGLPKDPKYGLELMRKYVQYGHPSYKTQYFSVLTEFEQNLERHQPYWLKQEMIRKKEAEAKKRRQESAARQKHEIQACIVN